MQAGVMRVVFMSLILMDVGLRPIRL